MKQCIVCGSNIDDGEIFVINAQDKIIRDAQGRLVYEDPAKDPSLHCVTCRSVLDTNERFGL